LIRRVIAVYLVVTISVTLVSCASSPAEPEPEVHFRTIALVSPKEVIDASKPKTRGERAGEGAGKGSVAGTLGGAAVGALACGPFLYGLCVTAAASAGLITGGATGALYGFTGFPKDAAKKLERNVEALSKKHDLQSALVDHIKQQVPSAMLVEPEVAEIQAVLIIENVEFVKKSGKVHLESTVRATFESTESRRVPEQGSRVFKGKSSEFLLEDWLSSDSGDLEEAIRQSLLSISGKIVSVLNDRWRPTTVMR
jgi:hypothetical protein